MKVNLDYDKETGKIQAIFENSSSNLDSIYEAFNWPDHIDTLNLSHYKFIDHQLVEIDEEESNELYWKEDKDDPRVKQMQMQEQQDAMVQLQRQSFLSMISDAEAASIPLMFDAWVPEKDYKTGDRIHFDGVLYKVLHDHHSKSTWKPKSTSALYAPV